MAVCEFQVSPTEAWELTPQEWWLMHNWKFRDKEKGRKPSATDVARMRKILDEELRKERDGGN